MADGPRDRRIPWPALALVATVGLALFAAQGSFSPVSLGELNAGDVGTVFLALVLAALVIERAVEVYVGNVFDGDEARLTNPQRQKRAEYERIRAALDSETNRARGASAEDREGLRTSDALDKLRGEADRARRELDRLRVEAADDLMALKTRKAQVSSAAATVLGALVAAVGLRVLGGLAPEDELKCLDAAQRFWFDGVDVLLTALLLAGGADGIHNVLGDFLKRRRELGESSA
ncbi:MAG TPA: hypothetical protein VJ994_14030 [Paracoccaceae bacterium]|nr:hypothetical protein [Paracoccaceae bacterium]